MAEFLMFLVPAVGLSMVAIAVGIFAWRQRDARRRHRGSARRRARQKRHQGGAD